MLGMDRLQLLGEINQRFPALSVMMVAAYGDEERRRRASELGAPKFLSRPVDFYLLNERLHQLSTATDGNNTARRSRSTRQTCR
jgi:DNA-binding NtrC family response regulator